ncbi:SDR family oxidoreductase [Teredinibacter turnerae]|uniref:SDR family oxidoreductase n=1 Tax=Teredinibacter turnerae TaxID=2426 RepID=UPI00037F8BB4|nr:SDR family oxidoreductase [Teredinibacter turnerae]
MNHGLHNKRVLITGANGGIGTALVSAFLAAGAQQVVMAVRNTESAVGFARQFGSRILVLPLDLTSATSVTDLASQAGPLDIVVNNAGAMTLTTPLAQDVEARFQQELEVNTFGLLRMAKAFTPVLEKSAGVFIQVNSIASLISDGSLSTYSASKAASFSFTLALKATLKAHDIRVISVHPGPIDTPMAASAGFSDIAEPPEVVAEAVLSALTTNDFLVFPDKMAKEFGDAFQPFANAYLKDL